MSDSSLGHKEQKIQLHEIHTMFRSWDRGQINKMVIDLFYRGSNFQIGLISTKMSSNWLDHQDDAEKV